MSVLAIRKRMKKYSGEIVWRKAVQGARRSGTSLEAEICRVIAKYAAMSDDSADRDDELTPNAIVCHSPKECDDLMAATIAKAANGR